MRPHDYRQARGQFARSGEQAKDKGHLASISYAMGATTLGLQMGKFNNKDMDAATTANNDLSTWTVGAYHALSKRTQAYVGYHNAKYGVSNDTLGVKVLTMGLNHSF